MLHVVRFTQQQQRTRTTRAAEKYTYTPIYTALRLSIILTSTNEPTCLTCMYYVPNLSDPLSQQEIHSGQSLRESRTPAWPVTRLAGRRRRGGEEASGFATAMDTRSLAGAEKTRRRRWSRSRRGQEEGGAGGSARDDDVSVLRPRKEMRYYFTGKSG